MDFYSFGVTVGVGYLAYKGYITAGFEWLWLKKKQAALIWSLMGKLNTPPTHTRAPTFTSDDMSAAISYDYIGEHYNIRIPFNRKFSVAMSQFKVELLRAHESPLDITQQPGIPYLVSAEDLGGYIIRITNMETGAIHEYPGLQCPMYGEEVMEDE